MKTIRRIWDLIPVFILISGCARSASLPSTITPPAITTQTAPAVSLGTPSPAITATSRSTQPVESTPIQQNGSVVALTLEGTPGGCQLNPVLQPPRPTKTYQPNELDTDTGLHVTGLMQWIDISTYLLKVTGLVEHPLSLTYDDVRCMPKVTDNPLLNCPGVFRDQASWTGVRINYILDLAGVQQDATEFTLVSADGYQVKIPLETARADKNFLAYEVNGETLPVAHGFPLRAVFPGMWGSYWLKWLVEIKIS